MEIIDDESMKARDRLGALTCPGHEGSADMTSRRRGGKSSGKPSVPQPHGGALVPGAGGGRQPGSGRPPSRIRHALRQSFEDRIRLLGEIADGAGGKTTVGDRLRALDILAKYGLGADRSHHDEELVEIAGKFGLPKDAYDQDLINELWDATEGALPQVDPAVIHKIKKAWVPVLASRLM